MATGVVSATWVVTESKADDFVADAKKGGAEINSGDRWIPDRDAADEHQDKMEPLMAVVLVVAGGWLLRRVADVISDIRKPGSQLVDLRRTPALFRPLPNTKPPGTLVVVLADGKVNVFAPDRHDEGLALLKSVFGKNGG